MIVLKYIWGLLIIGIVWPVTHGQGYVEDEISVAGADIDDEDEVPTITLTPGDPGPLELSFGHDLYSECAVTGEDDYSLKWVQKYPDGSVREISQTPQLFIGGVQERDLQYPLYCQATRAIDGKVFEKVLNVRLAPEYNQPIPEKLTLTIHSLPNEDLDRGSILRRCTFDNSDIRTDLFEFRWIDQNGRVVSKGDTLYLMVQDPADLVNYICEAKNRQTGVIYQAKYRITRAMTEKASQHFVNIRPITKDVIIGRPYEMICEVEPPPQEPVTFTWYHSGRRIGNEPELRVPSLTYQEIGTYTCRAEWTPATLRSGSLTANATTELNLALTQEPSIEMREPPGSVMVSLPGETRELHCEFTRPNPTNVRWYYENQPLESHPTINRTGRIYRTDRLKVSIITIRGVEMSHAGSYECRVDNDIKQTHLIVRGEEGIEINPTVDIVNEDDPVEFHCRIHGVKGDVNREIQWFFKSFGSPNIIPLDLTTSEGFVRHDDPFTQHTSFVSRARARLSDQGEYICRLPSQNAEIRGKLYIRPTKRYRVTITPSTLKVRVNQPIEFECFSSDESGRAATVLPRFRIKDARIPFETDRIAPNRVRFRIPSGLTLEQTNTIVECYTAEPGTPASATITVEDTCPQGFRRCRSGQCLPAGRFCDGVRDCPDGSDEDQKYCNLCDPIAKKCEVYQGRQPLKNTYMVHWTCDGEDDCGNSYDESNCAAVRSERCNGQHFQCGNSERRIPMAFVCDGERDCPNGEDERFCGQISIAPPRTPRQTVRVGGQVVLQCEVIRNPAPHVIWRFNWGCLPEDDPRFTVTNVAQNCGSDMPRVISTLTISNVRPGDDGIYNCEALSGSTRALSSDYFVMLEM